MSSSGTPGVMRATTFFSTYINLRTYEAKPSASSTAHAEYLSLLGNFLSGKPSVVMPHSEDLEKLGLTAAIPMCTKELIVSFETASCDEQRAKAKQGPSTQRYIRTANFLSGTVGFALSLLARIIRVLWRTGFAILTIPFAVYQGKRYSYEGWWQVEVKRIMQEWIDLGVTLTAPFAGLVTTLVPTAGRPFFQKLRSYYIARIEENTAQNVRFEALKDTFEAGQAEAKATAKRVKEKTEARSA